MVILRATDNFGNKADLDILDEGGLFCDVSAIESEDLGSVFGVSSKEFILPGTDNNNAFFGNLFNLSSNPSVALNHTIYASVLIDGQEGFDGRMYINDIVTDQKGYTVYKAIVVNEFIDFKQRLRNLKMQDLDFSHLDHDLTFNNVTSSWDGNLVNGDVVYPLVDYGTSTTNIAVGAAGDVTFNNQAHGLRITDLKPGLKVKSIIDAVFDQVNYQYSSSFIDGDYFDKIFTLATPNENRGIPGADPTTRRARANFKPSLSQSIADGATAKVVFPNEEFDNDNNYDPATGTYTVSAADDYEFATYLDLEWDSAPSSGNVHRAIVELRVNGTQVAQKYLFSSGTDTFGGLVHFESNMSVSDTVEVFVTNETLDGGISGPVIAGSAVKIKGATTGTSNKSVFDATSFATQAEAGVVKMNQIFPPDMSVEEFLLGIINKFNLIIEPKQNERNVLTIEPFNTWVDAGVKRDWTAKVDNSVRKSIRGTMVDQAFIVNFKDAEDEDFLNQYNIGTYGKVFGEKLYNSDSDLTQGTKVIGEFFAPTPIASIDGSDSDYIPMLYKDDNGTKTPFTFKPRLLHFNGKKRVFDIVSYNTSGNAVPNVFYMRNDAGTAVEISQYGSFHYLDLDANDPTDILPLENLETKDLNWDNLTQRHYNSAIYPQGFYAKRDAIYEYWSFYLNELYDPESKILTCNVKFNPEEISTIQLNDQIFIEGNYYRINKISNFPLTEEASVQVSLIKAPVRKMRFPRRRIYNIDGPNNGGTGTGFDGAGGGFTDVTIDDNTLDPSGDLGYVFFDDLLPPTGSGNQGIVRRAATVDGLNYYPNDSGSAVWRVLPPSKTTGFRQQVSQGENEINYSANNVTALGNNNTIKDSTNIISIQGSDNEAQAFTEYVSVQGDNNTVEEFTKKSSIISSTNSSLKNQAEFATIIGGEDTIISGSNKSVAIGQDLIIQGGNSNIAIGNFDTNTREVKDLINTVVINPNRDLETRENLGGDDFNGRAYIGTQQTIGAVFADNKKITMSAGETLWLTGSDYANDYIYDLAWSGGSGTANLYLPSTDPDNVVGRDSQGYKRMLRFIGDNTLSSSTKININASGSDSIDGASGGSYEVSKAYEGIMLYAPEVGEWFIIQKKA